MGYHPAGVPPLPGLMGGGGGIQGGVPPQQGYPLARSDGGYPRWGNPLAGVPPSQVQWGAVPNVGYSPGSTWLGYSPLGVDRQNDGQTRVKTLPSRRTTYAVGN